MLVLALDTTTRAGSVAVARDGTLLATLVGDAGSTHAARLPGDLLDCLSRCGLGLSDVDVFGVAAGPGSFTGLRIGIAAIQGLAFARGTDVVPVSALDALAASVPQASDPPTAASGLVVAWMDAQRGEVYAQLFQACRGGIEPVEEPLVDTPRVVLERWHPHLIAAPWLAIGDGASAYADLLRHHDPAPVGVVTPVPPLAPAIAVKAAREAAAGRGVVPHAIKPLYIRRPDAVLARERRHRKEP